MTEEPGRTPKWIGYAATAMPVIGSQLALWGLILDRRQLLTWGILLMVLWLPMLALLQTVVWGPANERGKRAARLRAGVRGTPDAFVRAIIRRGLDQDWQHGFVSLHRERVAWHDGSSVDDIVIERDAITGLVEIAETISSRLEWQLNDVVHSLLIVTDADLAGWLASGGIAFDRDVDAVELPPATARIVEEE